MEKQRAGHLPTLDLVAAHGRFASVGGSLYDVTVPEEKYTQTVVGVQLSVPLYAGGGISASTRQASRAMEQAEYELEGKTRETLIELRRQFSACLSGVNKLRAYQKALKSAEALVVSTKLWSSLSPADKAAFQKAGLESALLMRELWNKRVAQAQETTAKQGAQFVRVKDVSPFVRRMSPLYGKYMNDPNFTFFMSLY